MPLVEELESPPSVTREGIQVRFGTSAFAGKLLVLVGYYEGEELRYAGGVELGLTADALEALRELLPERARTEGPFQGRTSPW